MHGSRRVRQRKFWRVFGHFFTPGGKHQERDGEPCFHSHDCLHLEYASRASPIKKSEPVITTTSSSEASAFTVCIADSRFAAHRPRPAISTRASGRIARAESGAVKISSYAKGNRISAISSIALSRIAPYTIQIRWCP